jgi:hypothetical protein
MVRGSLYYKTDRGIKGTLKMIWSMMKEFLREEMV